MSYAGYMRRLASLAADGVAETRDQVALLWVELELFSDQLDPASDLTDADNNTDPNLVILGTDHTVTRQYC